MGYRILLEHAARMVWVSNACKFLLKA